MHDAPSIFQFFKYEDYLLAVISSLKLSPKEARYFSLLIEKKRMEKKGTDAVKIESELNKINPLHYKQEIVTTDLFPYVAHWYNFVIKQLVSALKEAPRTDWIYLKLKKKVPEKKIEEALRRLLDLGFFKVEPKSGKWTPIKGNIQSTFNIPSSALRMHHRERMAHLVPLFSLLVCFSLALNRLSYKLIWSLRFQLKTD